ncbi:MAG: sulfite exporter TauE/SafE family protein [Caldilinea sp.]|uniref:sulfite exporter TauE/SafE family protein n=1 Tax=Caldilinea sp. TaxID=2293560 RepID=UPI002CA868B2|nr:sulfite exporter TauE/SafE family protein [Caldilinea sp.]HRA66184.1 sulfite exporter TauE/SafE family protein [Caldilinea sp.]
MMDLFSITDFILIGLAAVAAGLINAIAGGGTLISFPVLIAVGVPPVAANVTNTVALVPGYLGATFAQLKDLSGQGRRLRLLIPVGAVGGLAGGLLLLNTSEKLFNDLVPYLILLAAGLLAVQDIVRKWVTRRIEASGGSATSEVWAIGPVFLAAIYGGYFGAGLSVIVLAVLGLVIDDTLTRLNGLKQIIAFSVNVAAAIFFVFSGQVVWIAAAVMAVGAILGGVLGGKLAGRIKPQVLRAVVVTIAVIVAIIYLVR